MTETPVVHVVDDDDAVRDSLTLLLESAGLTAHTYSSPTQLLESPPKPPGCILTDVRMPEMDGLTLQRHLAESGVRLPVIVMTGHADVPLAVDALKGGAADFLEKPFDDTQLLAAVTSAIAASQRSHNQDAALADIAARLATLTPRETEVLQLLVQGLPNKTIAYDLGSSPRTVEVHRARIMEKMAVRSLAELVRLTIAVGGTAPAAKPSRR
jgi:two-component system response regulator FixJ